MQRTREAAIASAVEKAKSEINSTSAATPNTDELTKKHAQEMAALRAEHEAALKNAVDAAVAAAKADATHTPSDNATKAAIEAAIADHDKKMHAKHAEEISAAVERGRMEQGAKSKLKDAQLVRSQAKVKELEAQVLEWRRAGLIPDGTAPAAAPTFTSATAPPVTPTTPVASTSTIPAPAPAPTPATKDSAPAPAPAPAPAREVPIASTSTSVPAPNPNAAAPPPSASVGPARRALGGAVPLGTTDNAARGRGTFRGRPPRGISIRGAAPGRGGGGAGTGPSPTATTAAAPVGVQIMGAANKRGRDDETQPDDSLAKRLKPAAGEGAAATGGAGAASSTAGGNKPPIAIRRPPPS